MRLRDFTPADAEFLVMLDEPPEVRRYVLQPDPTTIEGANRFIERVALIREADPRFGFWIVEQKDSGTPMGWVHFRDSRFLPGIPELGYRFHPSFWGQGHATEASIAVLMDSFRDDTLSEAIAVALPGNVASVRIMLKLGMQFRQEIMYLDQHALAVYGITRESWLTSEGTSPK